MMASLRARRSHAPPHGVPCLLLSVAIDDRAQMDGVLAGAGAPEAAPMAPKLTRSLSGDKPWRCYEESYTQALCLLGLHLLWPGLLWLYLQRLHLL